MRLLIADSGATKTDWAWLGEEGISFHKTTGLHPAYMDSDKALGEIQGLFSDIHPDRILFYGAGCYSEETIQPLRALLSTHFGDRRIDFYDDLTAVAHAFLGFGRGVAAILGTGSNSALFDDGHVIHRVAALGYVLGDEGSAADIGKRILKSALRDELSPTSMTFLHEKLGPLDYRKTVRQLYGAARPSYYLAKTAGRLLREELPGELSLLVDQSLESFVEAHLKRYEGFPNLRVVLSGGVAISQKKRVERLLKQHGVQDFGISAGVIGALAEHHAGAAAE